MGFGMLDAKRVKFSREFVIMKSPKVARHLCSTDTALSGDCSLG